MNLKKNIICRYLPLKNVLNRCLQPLNYPTLPNDRNYILWHPVETSMLLVYLLTLCTLLLNYSMLQKSEIFI